MGLTLTRKHGPYSLGGTKAVVYEAQFDNSYPANGESLTPEMMGLSEIIFVGIDAKDEASGKMLYHYDYANEKILALYPTGGTGTVPTSLGDPIIEAGSTAVVGSGTTGKFTPGRGVEVADATDLSTMYVRIFALGF